MFNGLILMALYPDYKNNISDWNESVLSLHSENDSPSTIENIENAKNLLPEGLSIYDWEEITTPIPDCRMFYHMIEGGNHTQLGNYGKQKNDGKVDIEPSAQHSIILDFCKQFLYLVENN